jgi:hypothetical protein
MVKETVAYSCGSGLISGSSGVGGGGVGGGGDDSSSSSSSSQWQLLC